MTTVRSQITLPEGLSSHFQLVTSDLLLAIKYSKLGNNFEIAKSLLENYENINKIDKNGEILLNQVLMMNDAHINNKIIKLIIDKGSHINKIPNPFAKTIDELKDWISIELISEITKYVDANISIRVPLILATKKNNIEIVEYLLAKGANIDEQDNNKDTMLTASSEHCKDEIFNIAIKFKANVGLLDKNGKSALDFAFINDKIEYAKILFNEGAKIQMLENNGVDHLKKAISNKKLEMCLLLINNGVNIETEVNYLEAKFSLLMLTFIKCMNDDLVNVITLMLTKVPHFDKHDALKKIDSSNKELLEIIKNFISNDALKVTEPTKPEIVSNIVESKETLKINNELLLNAIKSKNINMIKILLKKQHQDENILIEICRMNDMDLLKFFCENINIKLKYDELFNKLVNDNINTDILDFIYNNFK